MTFDEFRVLPPGTPVRVVVFGRQYEGEIAPYTRADGSVTRTKKAWLRLQSQGQVAIFRPHFLSAEVKR